MKRQDVLKQLATPIGAPMADFLVREIVSASHILTELTLARAKRCYDYLENSS